MKNERKTISRVWIYYRDGEPRRWAEDFIFQILVTVFAGVVIVWQPSVWTKLGAFGWIVFMLSHMLAEIVGGYFKRAWFPVTIVAILLIVVSLLA